MIIACHAAQDASNDLEMAGTIVAILSANDWEP
jgi:hypothetical protein